MPKSLQFLLCQMLIAVSVFTAFTSCSSDDDDFDIVDDGVDVVSPIKNPGAEITRFFDTEIKNFFLVESDSPVDGMIEYRGDDKNMIVNSTDHLLSLYKGSRSVPDIDFEKYTLILGTVYVPSPAYQFKTRLVAYETFYQLNVYVKPVYKDGYVYISTFLNKYYWLLYPKLPASDIKTLRINL